MCPFRACSLAYIHMLSIRLGKVRPFIGARSYDNGDAGTLQLGVTTYADVNDSADESYQTTYIEFGGRSDHLADAIDKAQGKDVATRLVTTASASEQRYCATEERNASDKSDKKPALEVVPEAS